MQVNNFSVMSGRFPGLKQYMTRKCLAQGHTAASLVRFKAVTSRSEPIVCLW